MRVWHTGEEKVLGMCLCICAMAFRLRRIPAVFLLVLISGVAFGEPATVVPSRANKQNILLLYSYGHGGKGVGVFDEALLAALGAGGISTNSLFFEYCVVAI